MSSTSREKAGKESEDYSERLRAKHAQGSERKETEPHPPVDVAASGER